MSGFFSKIFGGKKKATSAVARATGGSAVSLVERTMQGLIEKAQLDLYFEVRQRDGGGDAEEITVELSGADQEFLTEKDGALLDAFQLFFKRVLQHQLPDARVNVGFDCNGFRDELSKGLIDLADGLKEKCLSQGRAVYLRALPPKDRKIVHQYLASDERVRSRSVGDGLYKKIKIYPVKATNGRDAGRPGDEREESGSEHAETV